MSEWQTMESAPKEEVSEGAMYLMPRVDLWASPRRFIDCWWNETDKCWMRLSPKGYPVSVSAPTHWMPSPSPPGEER